MNQLKPPPVDLVFPSDIPSALATYYDDMNVSFHLGGAPMTALEVFDQGYLLPVVASRANELAMALLGKPLSIEIQEDPVALTGFRGRFLKMDAMTAILAVDACDELFSIQMTSGVAYRKNRNQPVISVNVGRIISYLQIEVADRADYETYLYEPQSHPS